MGYWGQSVDYIQGYGVNLTNIILFITLLILVRQKYLNKKLILINQDVKVVLFFATIFLIIGVSSSAQYAPNLFASLVWLMQYAQAYLVGISVFYWFMNYKSKIKYLYDIIAFTIFVESLLSLVQFIKQSDIGIPIESRHISSFYVSGIDQVNLFFRPFGTFLYANQLALILVISVAILLPYALKYRNNFYIFASILGTIVIIVTQSRSVWVTLVVILFITLNAFSKEVKLLVSKYMTSRLVLYGLVVVGILSIVFVPRIIKSFNLGYEGSGLSIRRDMLNEAKEAISINPWVGYGIGTNEYVLQKLFPQGVMSHFPSAVHTGYVQMVLEVGALGLLSFLAPFYYLFRKSLLLKKSNTEKDPLSLSFKLVMCILMVYYLVQPYSGSVEFVYLGIFLGFGLVQLRYDHKN